ncbi:MAG: glycosyltransferase [Lentisphaerota bacterium]
MTDRNSQFPFALSVVVIGRNEGERLIRCIKSVRNMNGSFSCPEIFYVDSASADGSPELARSLGVYVVTLQGTVYNAAMARNSGWRAARSEYILLLDGDTELDAEFVESAKNKFEDSGIAAVYGRREEKEPQKNIFHRVIDVDWFYPAGDAEYFGGDVLIRRRVLEEAGGFNETLMAGEEPELSGRIRRNGYRILRLDIPMTSHDIHMTSWRQYWARIERTGYAYAQISAQFPLWAPVSWQGKVRRTLLQAGAACVITAVFAGWFIFTHSFLPLILWSLGLIYWVAKNTSQFAPRRLSLCVSVLCGIHRVFSRIPLSVGMVSYYWDRRQNDVPV